MSGCRRSLSRFVSRLPADATLARCIRASMVLAAHGPMMDRETEGKTMKTISRNRWHKIAPRILCGAVYNLANQFNGSPMDAEQARAYLAWCGECHIGKLQADSNLAFLRVHSNEHAEFRLAEDGNGQS